MWSELGDALDAVAAAAWAGGLRAVAALGAVEARRWASPGGGRVLVVAPHPDDEVAGCGGAIRRHLLAGDGVTVLHVTDGRASRALGLDADAMAARRRAEAAESVRAAGVTRWEWLALPENAWADGDLARAFAALFAEIAPTVLYVPSRVDFHPEHRRVAAVVAAVVAQASEPALSVRCYQVQVPLTRLLVNLVVPIGDVLPDLRAAAGAYGSQRDALESALRLKRYAAAAHGIDGAAEELWEMSARAFAALHREAPAAEPAPGTLRGLRRRSFTDPLAFALGRRERGRLRRLADAG